jgi:sirohydrochlorin ferrochelatase
MKAILLIAHGSKSSQARQEVIGLAQVIQEKEKANIFEFAFLDVESPTIPEGIELCVVQGASEIYILLHFLNSGNHVRQDIPRLIQEAKSRYPQVIFHKASPIGLRSEIQDLYSDMLRQMGY